MPDIPDHVIEEAAVALHAASDLAKVMPWAQISARTQDETRQLVRDSAAVIWDAAIEHAAAIADRATTPAGVTDPVALMLGVVIRTQKTTHLERQPA